MLNMYLGTSRLNSLQLVLLGCFTLGSCSSCAVVSLAGAAVTVVSTAVSVGATVVGTTVDVGVAEIKAVAGSKDGN